MSVKLKPSITQLNLDTSSLTLTLPDINLIIPEEKKPEVKRIQVFKPQTKSNSYDLF